MSDRKEPRRGGDEFMHVPDDQGKPLPEELNTHELEQDQQRLGKDSSAHIDAMPTENEMDEQTKVCLHDECHCRVSGDDLYCSDHCRNGGGSESDSDSGSGCGCGHEQCGARAGA